MLWLLPFITLVLAQTPPNPETIAYKVATTIFSSSNIQNFLNHGNKWDYGCCLSNVGLFEVLDTFTTNTTENKYILGNVSTMMDLYYQTGREAYNVTNNITMPFESTPGDHLGLYPTSYLMRYDYAKRTGGTVNPNDLTVATRVATQYILGYPTKTPDGTICRNGCWGSETGKCLWGDDMFMGLTLVTRLAAYLKNESYITWAANQKLGFAKGMQDSTGLFYHGFDATDNHTSCCKWSRANGWAIMSHVEELLAFETFPTNTLQPQILSIFQKHAAGFKKVQDTTGLFRQVLNETNIWLETSTTAMVVWSLANGIMHKWITDADYGTVVDKAWAGVASTVQNDGTVNGICEGCGIQTSEQGYADRSTAFTSSEPGLGSIFRAAAAYGQLLKWRAGN